MMITFLEEHWLDIVTTILGLAYILLEYKASLWMWLVGFLMQALGIVLYYQKGLYADCGMEFYYLAMTVYGYWRWISRPSSSPESGEVRRGLKKGMFEGEFCGLSTTPGSIPEQARLPVAFPF